MTHSFPQQIFLRIPCRAILLLLAMPFFFSCHAQSPTGNSIQPADSIHKATPVSLPFTAHVIKNNSDGSRGEIDTITGYRKYYYPNGKLQMEGKVTKASPKDYRDGIWSYYNEKQQLMNQETYNKEGKVNQRAFTYFITGKPMSETYQYYEGDYKDKASFRFHKIEKLFYTNGTLLSERHSINGSMVETKCWDKKGNPAPLEYLETVKSLSVDE